MNLLLFALALADFVQVDGTRFTAGGKPFHFVGANLAVMHGRDRARAADTLEAAHADGLTVGRVWALGEGPADASEWSRSLELFRAGPDEWLEAGFAQLDRVLQLARARGIRLIVVLGNRWGDYGGLPMYLRWGGLPVDGWGARDRFYSSEKTRAWFRAHVEKLVARYRDDPTIFAWELVNESAVESDVVAHRAFVQEMARLIKSRDPHHLVSSGASIYTSRAERLQWLELCRLPEVDYCDAHLYPQTTDEVDDAARLDAYIDDRAQLAEFVAKKPIVFGEFSFLQENWLGAPRAAWFERFLQRAFLDGAAGALAWIYQPGAAREFSISIDRPDEVRRVLSRWARKSPSGTNPLLGPSRGAEPLYDPYRLVRHDPVAHALDGLIELPVEHFSAGRFERVGVWKKGPLVQAYGAPDGFFEWKFHSLQGQAQARLRMRLSSEYPGASAPADGGSQVFVSLDGQKLGTLEVIADDGMGRIYELPAALLAGPHTLRLEVAPGPRAHGVCVYGAPTGEGSPPSGEALPIQLLFKRADR